jgi:hypothetical protein
MNALNGECHACQCEQLWHQALQGVHTGIVRFPPVFLSATCGATSARTWRFVNAEQRPETTVVYGPWTWDSPALLMA